MALASSFTVLPFVGGLLAGNPDAFRLLALPGGLAVLVVPAIVYFRRRGRDLSRGQFSGDRFAWLGYASHMVGRTAMKGREAG
jgi:hypothetical protein